jgi:hypothetical protein
LDGDAEVYKRVADAVHIGEVARQTRQDGAKRRLQRRLLRRHIIAHLHGA